MKHLKIIFCIALLLVVQLVDAQSVRRLLESANKAFSQGNYFGAAQLYENVLQRDSNQILAAFQCAEANRLCNDFKTAEKWYKLVLKKDSTTYPLAWYNIAEMQMQQGKYSKAIEYFTAYSKRFQNDSNAVNHANNAVTRCQTAIKLSENKQNIDIQQLKFGVDSAFAEYAVFTLADTALYYTINRSTNQDTSLFRSKILLSKKKNDNWQTPKILDKNVNDLKSHQANVAYSTVLQAIIFTRCNMQNNSICQLYFSKLSSDGRFLAAKPLPKTINVDSTINTQASVVKTRTGEILLFVSNRKGGFGKLDIWYATIFPDGKFGEVQNLGEKINTTKDDITPFYIPADSSIYFSSTAYDNLGGFDIFRAKGNFVTWEMPENMGVPINTSYNDLYYTIDNVSQTAYLSSNRPGSFKFHNETCCNSIYYYKIPPKPEETPQLTENNSDNFNSNDSLTIVNQEVENFTKQLNALLPLNIYFDNDQPNPRSKDTITTLNYTAVYASYKNRLQEYEKNYSSLSRIKDKQKAKQEIDDFFVYQLDSGYQKLQQFVALAEKILTKGKALKITVKGYSSPLFSDEYNNRLSKRRIASLLNFMIDYKQGFLKQYIDKQMLSIAKQSFGESKADKSVSDDPKNVKESIFSPNAAKQRRIEIIGVVVE